MEGNYIKKPNRGEISQHIFEKACVAIEKDSISLKQSAKIYNIAKITLLRYINKKKKAPHGKVGYSRHKTKIKIKTFIYVCSKICLIFRIRLRSFLVYIDGKVSRLKIYFSHLLVIH